MVALLLASLSSVFLFFSLGAFFSKIVSIEAGIAVKLFIGLVIANSIASIASLFMPVSFYLLAAVLFLAVVSFVYIKTDFIRLVIAVRQKKMPILMAAPFILIAFWVCSGQPTNYDTGLYHLQSIKWIEEYGVVPGLANLHSRFGFNPNVFTLYALTSFKSIFGQEIFVVNFILFSASIIYFLIEMLKALKQNGASNIFIFNGILFVIVLGGYTILSSPTPDFVSLILNIFIFSYMLRLSEKDAENGIRKFIPILILCTYTLTVKLANLPLTILVVFILLKHLSNIRKWVSVLPWLGLIILPWLARNVIISGWLVYPFPALDLFSFDWKIPVKDVIHMKEEITGWSRVPGDGAMAAAKLGIQNWFPLVWIQLTKMEARILIAAFIFPVIYFVGLIIKKIKYNFYVTAIISASFLGVFYWLLLAPDFRFGQAFITMAALSPLLYLQFDFKLYSAGKPLTVYLFYTFLLFYTLSFSWNNVFRNAKQLPTEFAQRLIKPQIIANTKGQTFETYRTDTATIFVPKGDERCFNHCIPCTPYPDTTLALRNGTISSGFKHSTTK